MERQKRQLRAVSTEFETREENEQPHITGYFAVYNSNYEIWQGASESIAPGAFSNTLGGDIRALTNHDTTLVLGRNKAGTLTLKDDSHGLWGDITINPNDSDAMNTYERVKRGDVSQCSIGFTIRDEETEFLPNGDVHWTIKDVELFEVSVCTFPAYEETSVTARDRADVEKKIAEAWKIRMKERLKNAESTFTSEED